MTDAALRAKAVQAVIEDMQTKKPYDYKAWPHMFLINLMLKQLVIGHVTLLLLTHKLVSASPFSTTIKFMSEWVASTLLSGNSLSESAIDLSSHRTFCCRKMDGFDFA